MTQLQLHKNIYRYTIIARAVRDYSELADIEVKETDFYWIVSFSLCRFDEEITRREFENYLIDLENVLSADIT